MQIENDTVLVKELKALMQVMHDKHPNSGILICVAERDANDAGFNVQTMVTANPWLGLFMKAVWEYYQLTDEGKAESTENQVH